jgi:hypothetical protein
MTILCNHRHIRSELGLSLNFFKISLIILVLSSTSVDLKKQLLVIKNLADNYPNSGSLIKTLNNFDKDLDRKTEKKSKKNYRMLVSILVDIALKNPKIHPVFASILSKIICDTDVDDRTRIIKLIFFIFNNTRQIIYFFCVNNTTILYYLIEIIDYLRYKQ